MYMYVFISYVCIYIICMYIICILLCIIGSATSLHFNNIVHLLVGWLVGWLVGLSTFVESAGKLHFLARNTDRQREREREREREIA